jgi:threonine dehydrogenase-like Zn-dependent dehydrogenase
MRTRRPLAHGFVIKAAASRAGIVEKRRDMPKELVATSPGRFEFREYDDPALGPADVRVETEFAAAKHGTEAARLKGDEAGRGRWNSELRLFDRSAAGAVGEEPRPVGNMFVGRVVEAGSAVSQFRVGERVLGYGTFRETHIRAESASLWSLPDRVSWKSAVCLDPADFALAAIRDGCVRAGDAVAVFGLGAVGLMVVQIAKVAGAGLVIGVDPIAKRRDAALIDGADVALDPSACDVGVEIKQATAHRGVDVAIEYSGSVHALQAALRGVAFGGTVVAGAYPAPYPPGLDLGAEAHLNVPQIVFSRARSDPNRDHPRWNDERIYETCWRWICEGRLDGDVVVDPVVPFADLPAACERILSTPEAGIKLGVSR